MKFTLLFPFFCILLSLPALALKKNFTIAVLDTGVDPYQKELMNHIWSNPNERSNGEDDDHNQCIDDIQGWNFIKGTGEIFDQTQKGSFSPLFFDYYNIRRKRALNTASESELKWYNQFKQSETYLEQGKGFRRYIHGTHVSGVILKTVKKFSKSKASNLDILAVVYLGNAKKGMAKKPEFTPIRPESSFNEKNIHLYQFLENFIQWQVRKLHTAIKYVLPHSKIINGSFGSSYQGMEKQISKWYQEQFSNSPKNNVLDKLTNFYMSGLVTKTSQVISLYPNNLFIFSAGNKKTNTDTLPHYPSGVRLPHVISVGASWGNKEKAAFSNFGETTIDLFAPGIAISSLTPEGKEISVNGTSQATPYISASSYLLFQLANKLKIKLSPALLKKILVKTVDKNEECISVSGGIVNTTRALEALKLTLHFPLKKAITKSFKLVPYSLSYPKKNHEGPTRSLIEQESDDIF
jgi:subtilisin family serine protease